MAENTNTTVAISAETGEIVAANPGDIRQINTLSANTFEERMVVLAAVNTAEPLADHMDETLRLVDFIVQTVMLESEKTKLMEPAPRITLITEDGKAFTATSKGVYNSLMQIVDIMPNPASWPVPIEVHAAKVGRGPQAFFTLNVGKGKK